jgi:AcrR family transcriptional regulator
MPVKTIIKPDTAKREAILAAAVHVFAREGFRGTDVQEVAERAGVGKGTVYRYFGDKQELFWDTVYWVLEKMDQHLAGEMAAAERPLKKLSTACRAYGEFFEQNPEYLEIFVLDRAEFRGKAPEQRVERHDKMIAAFGTIIEEGIAAGEIRPVVARDVVVALGGTLHGTVVTWAYAKVDRSLSEMTQYTAEIFLAGLRAKGGENG